MEYGLIGARLGHSFSPEIHKKIADYRYELCELTPEGVEKLSTTTTGRPLSCPRQAAKWARWTAARPDTAAGDCPLSSAASSC